MDQNDQNSGVLNADPARIIPPMVDPVEKKIQGSISKDQSWRTIISILVLIFLFPVGLLVMWLVARWRGFVKWLVTAVIIIPVALGIYWLIRAGYRFWP